MKKVWVVTAYSYVDEPVVTVFNNWDAAKACKEFLETLYEYVYIDICDIYSIFVNNVYRKADEYVWGEE